MNEKILIIEDDQAIVRVLKRSLTYEGYQVESALEGEDGIRKYQQFRPDLIILDWMLPGMDGLDVCDRIRSFGDKLPILMLTAKDTTHDRVQGLDSGVDDYMVKPFEIEELNARIRALLRRTIPERSVVLSYSDLELDTSTRLASRAGRIITLTAKEYDLLELFLRHPRQVLTRDVIFDRVWGYDFGGESNVLDVYIRYLRQKIEEKGETRLLYTVRGVGYVLRDMP
ncbi:MAG: DNA-binding response regulator [Chloroflexi bacterium 44-23]|nr:MAG: DNA-binding response regulator [Chloroflexi bacterium 44-23]